MLISRRQFSKIFSLLGLGSATSQQLNISIAKSEEDNICESSNEDIIQSETAISIPSDQINHWISGLYFKDAVLSARANVAILLKIPQSEASYIDKVVFADGDKRTLGVRYFSASDKISSDYVPYLVFNNINLNSSKKFYLVCQLREGKNTRIFRKTLSSTELLRSRLNGTQLPAKLRYELDQTHKGFISTPMKFKSTLPRLAVAQHIVRAHILELNNENGFSLQINFLHDDVDESHYMRNFIVTDPVGRILALHQRSFGDGQNGSIIINNISEAERNHWALTKDRVAKINDCPYIMVFVDDIKEALAQSILWLR